MDYRERGAGRVRSTHEAFQPPATEKERERERRGNTRRRELRPLFGSLAR